MLNTQSRLLISVGGRDRSPLEDPLAMTDGDARRATGTLGPALALADSESYGAFTGRGRLAILLAAIRTAPGLSLAIDDGVTGCDSESLNIKGDELAAAVASSPAGRLRNSITCKET